MVYDICKHRVANPDHLCPATILGQLSQELHANAKPPNQTQRSGADDREALHIRLPEVRPTLFSQDDWSEEGQ
jgi:hypothetical protein